VRLGVGRGFNYLKGETRNISPQLLLYLVCAGFSIFLLLEGLMVTPPEYFSAATLVAGVLFFVAPWTAVVFMDVKKKDMHHPFAIIYSLFQAFYVYLLTEMYVSLRIRDYPLTVLLAYIWEDVVYLALLVASGYFSYRAALGSTSGARFSAKIVTAILLLFFGIIHLQALMFSTDARFMILTAVFLTLASFTAISTFLEFRKRVKQRTFRIW
jgi:hypothetical protein